ncbi:MAG: NUDIX hydrolase [Gammaproteobacteria bacterium]|nr:NUDIX hydrolase [Gammaproteobacteria bacterium]
MRSQIHLTVAAVVPRDGHYLMVVENIAGERVLNQPAGHMEAGESPIEAVRRETLEETGWLIEPIACLGLACFVAASGATYHRLSFVCEPIGQITDQIDPDIETALWLPAAAIRGADYPHRSPMVRGVIEDHLAGMRYPLEMLRDYR